MQYVKPDYFERFQCIADKCPDTCWTGWKIIAGNIWKLVDKSRSSGKFFRSKF